MRSSTAQALVCTWEAHPGGGVIALTADGYPVLDRVAPNAYLILDGGRRLQAARTGELAASDLLDGGEPLLERFRLGRFGAGRRHVTSASPYPWDTTTPRYLLAQARPTGGGHALPQGSTANTSSSSGHCRSASRP